MTTKLRNTQTHAHLHRLSFEELGAVLRLEQQVRREASERLDDSDQQVVLRGAREQGQAEVQLRGDAAQGPHVDRDVVRGPQHDLRGAVEPAGGVWVWRGV